MSQPQQPRRRRWYQFSLRALLIAAAVAAGLAFAWAKCVEPYRVQRETMGLITKLGGTYKSEDATGWVRYLDGQAQNIVVVDLADCDNPDEYLPHLARLPRLKTLVIGGHSVGDEQVAALGRVATLRGLVLDSTLVSDAGLDALKEKVPDLVVWKSERRACAELEKLEAQVLRDDRDKVDLSPPRPVTPPPAWLRDDADVRYFRDPSFWVDLQGKPITDADLTWFSNLLDVNVIGLRNTGVTGDCFAGAVALSSLDHLNLRNTRVNDETIVHITRYTNLKSLDLFGTDLADDGVVHLVACNKLEQLVLANTRITDAGIKHIMKLSHLNYFVAPPGMGDQGLATVAELPMLGHLWLSGTNVTDEGLHYLKHNKKLKQLWCDGTRISDKGITHLVDCGMLESLVLSNTRITDECVRDLTKCPRLVALTVGKTGISPSGIQRLRKALPDCKIDEGVPFVQ